MTTRLTFASLIFFCAISLAAIQSASAITIPTVPIGNPGNGNDPLTGNLYGGVAYSYRIGTTEVTNAQYVAFLNAKAASDPLALYSPLMGSLVRGGITQSGVSGGFTYAATTNMADKPVNFVSWYSSIRFANWLNNGQGTGATETGAYTLGPLNPDGTPVNVDSITRNAGATWFLTSENEWYKAAYYQPAAQGGDADNYWLYPTASNSAPTLATANGVFLVLLFIGGMAYPLDKLPTVLEEIAKVLPAAALSESVRGALTPGVDVPGWSIVVLALWAIGAPLLAARFFRWEE